MFAKITSTEYPPAIRPIMVWDGNCPFCKFWVEYLKRLTADRIDYAPFQEVNDCFGDIPMEAFKGAVQFIEPDGKVYSGPDTAYRSLLYTKRPVPLFHRLYHQYGWFTRLSDFGYYHISENRPMMYRLTTLLLGSNPKKLKPYGLLWVGGLFLSVWLLRKK